MQTVEEKLQELERQEKELQFDSFSNETALKIGLLIVEEAAKRGGKGITVDITRSGQRLFVHAMEGTTVGNEDWIRRKNNVVGHFKQSSFRFATWIKNEGKTIEELYGLPDADYVASGGGFPLMVKEEGIIGTITVSGRPDYEDHNLIVDVLRSFLGAPASS